MELATSMDNQGAKHASRPLAWLRAGHQPLPVWGVINYSIITIANYCYHGQEFPCYICNNATWSMFLSWAGTWQQQKNKLKCRIILQTQLWQPYDLYCNFYLRGASIETMNYKNIKTIFLNCTCRCSTSMWMIHISPCAAMWQKKKPMQTCAHIKHYKVVLCYITLSSESNNNNVNLMVTITECQLFVIILIKSFAVLTFDCFDLVTHVTTILAIS